MGTSRIMAWIAVSVPLGAPCAAQVCQTKLFASDGESLDRFGYSVSISGARALIGAPIAGADRGAAYVFERQGTGWVQAATLTASDGMLHDWFGRSVSLAGTRALVGARLHDALGNGSGAAYAYELVGGAWTEVAKLTASDGLPDDRFGSAVATDGEWAIVGAPLRADAGVGAGAAYVFRRSGTTWVETQKLIPATTNSYDLFGLSIAMDGPLAVIGSPGDYETPVGTGTAFVYQRQNGQWIEQSKLRPQVGSSNDRFGDAVSIDVTFEGSTILVGARRHNEGFYVDCGAAYVFEATLQGWDQVAFLLSPELAAIDEFGVSVSVDGDEAIVGAWKEDYGPLDRGVAHYFERVGGVWNEVGRVIASDGGHKDEFGSALAIESGVAVVSAISDDVGGADSGSAYVLELRECVIARPFCRCETGAPCGNPDSQAGCANSTGVGAGLDVVAGGNGVIADDLVLASEGLVPVQPAMLFQGTAAVNGGDGFPFGDGLRCAGGALVRLGVQSSDASGMAAWGPGLASVGGWSPGDRLYFQVWYRDPVGGPCFTGLNLSSAIEVRAAP